jgi:hypothetical protein
MEAASLDNVLVLGPMFSGNRFPLLGLKRLIQQDRFKDSKFK